MKAAILLCLIAIFYHPAPLTISTHASYYADNLSGHLMADGRPYNPSDLVCASWDFPLGTSVRVTAGETQRTVQVVVSDRGPARRIYERGVGIDLSRDAFKAIAPLSQGLVEVTVTEIK